jgi:hypothetical protein
MATNVLDKAGSIGALVAGMAVPCCFPFLSLFGSILGLSIFARYEKWFLYIMQSMVIVALVGSFIAYRGHKKAAPLLLAILSTATVIYGVNAWQNIYYIYPGMVGLLIVAVWNSIEAKRCEEVCKVK